MPQHTPGPWQIMVRDSVGDNIFTESKPYRRIANTYGDADEFQANARLIAAAPELLSELNSSIETLEEVADWMDRFALPRLGDDADGGNCMHSGLLLRIEEARAAIAKARGEVTA